VLFGKLVTAGDPYLRIVNILVSHRVRLRTALLNADRSEP
jgi:hypothetical protein